MPANLENTAVATGLEKVSFYFNPKERQCQRMLKLPHNCTHLTRLYSSPMLVWRRKWQPTPVFLPGESQGRGSHQAAVYGVAQSQTQLKRLSSSSRDLFKKIRDTKGNFHAKMGTIKDRNGMDLTEAVARIHRWLEEVARIHRRSVQIRSSRPR